MRRRYFAKVTVSSNLSCDGIPRVLYCLSFIQKARSGAIKIQPVAKMIFISYFSLTLTSRGEECDDGDLIDGDGCSSKCKREHAPPEGCCGDGIVQPGFGEDCDNGNLNDGDGCSSSCKLEKNPCNKCLHQKMCGDGIVQHEP